MNKELEKIEGKVKGMDMYVGDCAPKSPPQDVLYFFLVRCDLGSGLIADPGDTLVMTPSGWKQWVGDLTAPLDDLIERE